MFIRDQHLFDDGCLLKQEHSFDLHVSPQALSRTRDQEDGYRYFSLVTGHHVYKAMWTPILSETLIVKHFYTYTLSQPRS